MTNFMKIEQQQLTMTSREIAELIEKQHSHIKVSAERLAQRGVIGTLAVREFNHNGNVYTEYLLNKRDSLVLVAQNCPEFTARIVDRWQELEAKAQKPMTQIEVLLASVQMLADVEKRLVATEQQSKEVQGAVAKHESKFIDIESGLEDIKNTNILDHCPTHAESITAIRERMNKLYGLSMKVVDEVMRQSPLSLKPAHTIRNTNPAAKGSSYFVYHVKDVNKVFALFASQAEMVSVGRYKHPFIEGNFKMNK